MRLTSWMLLPILSLLSLNPVLLIAQSLVFGTVTDASTGDGVGDAAIIEEESPQRCTSDALGRYALVLSPGVHKLRLSRVGYKTTRIEVQLGEKDTVRRDVQLVPTTIMFGEVAAIGERPPLITVHGLGGISISPPKTETLSGPFSDFFKTLQTLPAVTSDNEMSSRFNVRGGTSMQNLMLFNGAEVLEPFHLKESPNTSLTTVNPDLLKRVLFVPGGFTARFGDRLSAVLDLEMREGNKEHFACTGEASLTSLGMTGEGPLFQGLTALISARTTYSSYVDKYLTDGDRRHSSFYDLQSVIGIDPSEGIHSTGYVLISRDHASGIAEGSYGSTLASLRTDIVMGDHETLRATISSYDEDQSLSWVGPPDPAGAGTLGNDFTTRVLQGGMQFEGELASDYNLVCGLQVRENTYDLRQVGEGGKVPVLNSRPNLLSLYAENLVQVTPRFLFNAGFRVDHSTLPTETKLSPRLLAAYRFDRGTTLRAAWGYYFQTATGEQRLAAERDGFSPPFMQRAIHYVAGMEQPLRKDLAVRLDIYHKEFRDLISFQRLRTGDIVYSPVNDARGHTDGLDFEVSFEDARVMGWVNAAFMIAKEISDRDGLGWRFSPLDQAKTVTVVFEYRFTEHFAANLRALYGSGFAYGVDSAGVPDDRMHYPDYKRADARIQYAAAFGIVRGIVYLEVMNLFGHRNVISFNGQLRTPTTPDFNLLLPTIVNVGVKFRM